MNKKIINYLLIGIGLLFVAIQFVPVDRSNPPVTREINWDAASTKDLARRACFDCHSNETVWPWYAYFAPVSWRVAEHVEHGREHLNFSEWDRGNEDFEEAKEEVEDGGMPLSDYLRLHPEAKLTEAETTALLEGLARTYEADPPIERRRGPPPSSTP